MFWELWKKGDRLEELEGIGKIYQFEEEIDKDLKMIAGENYESRKEKEGNRENY